jgi:hypothetical protein
MFQNLQEPLNVNKDEVGPVKVYFFRIKYVGPLRTMAMISCSRCRWVRGDRLRLRSRRCQRNLRRKRHRSRKSASGAESGCAPSTSGRWSSHGFVLSLCCRTRCSSRWGSEICFCGRLKYSYFSICWPQIHSIRGRPYMTSHISWHVHNHRHTI